MTPAVARLKRRSEFLRVAGARRKWVAPGLVLQARRHTPDDRAAGTQAPVRVGFTVSRKVGNAVQRNRARRRLRSAAEEVIPACAKEGYDFVVIGRAATLKRPFDGLREDLTTALKKLNAHRKPDGQGDRGSTSS